ncbi:hypothetical protein [Nocardia seriolae]|uniref:DUF4267 domain-containing protein n=1 Tax=Nocardia seriolae TaxID=37332 RepID=A0ABC8AXW2_9NOCA|nr:hypothetical protein [Nocardia seriolae]APA99058.1 hypothetical protein NS506_05012 [Nocardia seriolae]MTJ63945.1 hypothetical protein [Nocardia seriolae]MTJ71008.1 hypothetical protein [Nocardia seriolae]MTJ88670.1 hypothetical protein [Nocardia seriolae]MTK32651.1 hypothetical protein [Nocardia seriolae]
MTLAESISPTPSTSGPIARPRGWWPILALTAFTAVASAAFALAFAHNPSLAFGSSTPIDPGDQLYLKLFVVRSVALSILTLILVVRRARIALIPVMVLLAVNQMADGFIGIATHRAESVVAPMIQGVLLLACAGHLIATLDRPLRRAAIGSWRS